MMEFAWPWLFVLLPLPWLVQHLLPPADQARGGALHIPFFDQWTAGQSGQPSAKTALSMGGWIALLAWLLLVSAAARPQWTGEPVNLPSSGRDLMLAVDLSGSMEIADFLLQGEQVNRLSAVKAVAGDFIERRRGDRLGLVLFGKRAYLQTPLSFDRQTVRQMLSEAEIGLAGKETAIGDAIGLAVKRLRQRPEQSRVLILLTDGANTAGEIDPLQAAQLAQQTGLRIYTIGVGADSLAMQSLFGTRLINPSSELDEQTLQRIAELTDGRYFRAKDTQGLEAIYAELDRLEPAEADTESFRPVRSLFHWPLAAALVLYLLLGWRRGMLGRR